MSASHRHRSALLGEPIRLSLAQGSVEADRYLCIVLDLPFGAHRAPLAEDADLSAEGCGTLVADALETLGDTLGLDRVTLVDDCYSFTAEDQPRPLAEAIAAFAA